MNRSYKIVSFAAALSDLDNKVANCDARKREIAEMIARLVLENSENDNLRQKCLQQKAQVVAARETGVYESYTEYQDYLSSKATLAIVNARREALEKTAREKEVAAHAKVAAKVKEHLDHYVACRKYIDDDSDDDYSQLLEDWLKLSSTELENKWREMNSEMRYACEQHRDELKEKSDELFECPNPDCDVDPLGERGRGAWNDSYDEYEGCVATACDDYRTNGCGCKVRFVFDDLGNWWLYYAIQCSSLHGKGRLELR